MIKLTKNELRNQQVRLAQFQRYLPTLQLKKAMLQVEVNLVYGEIATLREKMDLAKRQIDAFSPFLLEKVSCNLQRYADVIQVEKNYENIAGVEIPILKRIVFQKDDYFLFDTPVWTDQATKMLRELVSLRETISVAQEKRHALEKELRSVSIRVNLFEKILIPRATDNIKKIKIFLGDQQLAAVAQAKVAKKKLVLKREEIG